MAPAKQVTVTWTEADTVEFIKRDTKIKELESLHKADKERLKEYASATRTSVIQCESLKKSIHIDPSGNDSMSFADLQAVLAETKQQALLPNLVSVLIGKVKEAIGEAVIEKYITIGTVPYSKVSVKALKAVKGK